MRRRRPRARRDQAVAQQLAYFGETLRASRHRCQLSVPRLAQAAGVSMRQIARGEAGSNISLRTLVQLAWATGMRLELVPGPAAPLRVIDRPGPHPPGALLFQVLTTVCRRLDLDAEALLPEALREVSVRRRRRR